MATSSNQPIEDAREGLGASFFQTRSLEGVVEHISN